MKLSISKYAKPIVLIAGLLPAFLSLSCSGVIFDEIRKEVKLADAVVTGDIQNVIRYKNKIYCSTGEIYCRSVDSDVVDTKMEFKKIAKPDGFVFSLGADSESLYALSIKIEEDDDGYNTPTKRTLWCYNGTKWQEIWSERYSNSKATVLFCTNTPKESNRHAYFRYNTYVWELKGNTKLTTENKMSAKESLSTGESLSTFDNKTVPTYATKSCTVLGSTVYFSEGYAMTSNETAEEDATCIYRSKSDNVYYSTDGSNWTSVDLNSSSIRSLAVTADYLFAGTTGGVVHTPLKAAADDSVIVPTSGNADFSTNADSTLTSYYEVPSIVVIDPSKYETSATIFATCVTSSTSASLNNVGLWSYFASEGEWNRE